MRQTHHKEVLRLILKALQNGGRRLSPTRFAWDISRGCHDPVKRIVWGRPDPGRAKMVTIAPGTAHTLEVELSTPCRQCEPCRRHRRGLWTARASAECAAAVRTWFGTLTLRPEEHYRFECAAEARARKAGWDWSGIPEQDRFLRVHAEISREITLFIKRVRKQTGARMRFIAVVERHKSGHPHYHMLIHEGQGPRVTYRHLAEQWNLGFTMFKLVDDKAALYVTKYLSKEAGGRVRASLRYGTGFTQKRIDALRHRDDASEASEARSAPSREPGP